MSNFKKINEKEFVESKYLLAEVATQKGNYKLAFDIYEELSKRFNDSYSNYQLGVFYAMGRGTDVDFLQSAIYFKLANTQGEEYADKLLTKSTLDYLNKLLNSYSEGELWNGMIIFAEKVYPEKNKIDCAIKELTTLFTHYTNKGESKKSFLIVREIAYYSNDLSAQYTLGYMYNKGLGVIKNDLIALYWFGKAAMNGHGNAKKDMLGLVEAYEKSVSEQEFKEYIALICSWCKNGTDFIPKDIDSYNFWLEFS
ncbi:MAG: tetratricopeptide repeat protein [Clostridia bacterium]